MLGDELEEDGLGNEVGDAMPDYLQPARKLITFGCVNKIKSENNWIMIFAYHFIYVFFSPCVHVAAMPVVGDPTANDQVDEFGLPIAPPSGGIAAPAASTPAQIHA
jgi:hypothetical protein